MSNVVLVLTETVNEYLPIIERQGFELILAPSNALRAEAIATHGQRIKAVLTRGPLGLFADEIAALPLLEIICATCRRPDNVASSSPTAPAPMPRRWPITPWPCCCRWYVTFHGPTPRCAVANGAS